MTHPQAALALKALADFWADMGLEEARVLQVPRAAGGARPAGPTRQTERAAAGTRPEPKRLNNNPIADARR